MLYEKRSDNRNNEEFFKNPGAIYRAAPFWAWNGKLDERILGEEIDAFHEMGLGGFFMHVRFGLEDKYLGEKFLQSVKFCAQKAQKEKMLAWLYDEDRWPSGCAGGLVTKNPAYRRKTMTFAYGLPQNFDISTGEKEEDYINLSPLLAAAYAVKTDENGALLSYRRISLPKRGENFKRAQDYFNDRLNAGERAYYAVIRCDLSSDWYNGSSYADNLSENAVAEFIRVTHETYLAEIGEKFGKIVPGIFSDEPNIEPYKKFGEYGVPWSSDFPKKFNEFYGEDVFERLPELYSLRSVGVFSEGARRGVKKDFIYRFYAFLSERFASAYSEKIGAWCKKHNLAFTGHYLCEDSLEGQTACSGDVMRQYAGYDIPGIDMLCDEREYITAVQVKSVANQLAKDGVMCELYGSTNWDFDFRGFKLQGDWLAAMGITLRVPHLAWYTMKGEGKRDYPASIGIQANWYKKFPLIEDHFARVNACLTRGEEIVNVAVIHPVESAWTATKKESSALTEALISLSETLYKSGVNFDFIDESMLPDLRSESNPLAVGKCVYRAVAIPRLTSLRKTTAEFLESFVSGGGKLLSLTDSIELTCGEETKNTEAAPLFKRLIEKAKIADTPEEVAEILKKEAFLQIVPHENESGKLVYRAVRENGGDRIFLFVCRADKPDENYTPRGFDFVIDGEYKTRFFDTESGEIFDFPCEISKGETRFFKIFEAQDSLLLSLVPYKISQKPCDFGGAKKCGTILEKGELPAAYEAETDEANVLLIDRARAYVSEEKECDEDETLRLDKKVREKIGMPPRDFFSSQPWANAGKPENKHNIVIEYKFVSEIAVNGARLAVELTDVTKIEFNKATVPIEPIGKYVDEAISQIALPKIERGENSVRLHVSYNSQSSIENIMILGDFSAEKRKEIANAHCERGVIVEKKAGLPWGRIDELGFAFYGGNVTYITKINVKRGGKLKLKAAHYKGNLIEIAVDGILKNKILYAPYEAELGYVPAGEHELRLTLYGNRFNTFGQLHNTTAVPWDGTYAWRTDGKEWSYDLLTRPIGIICAPVYEIYAAENINEGGSDKK